MLDRRGKDLLRLIEFAAGVQHMIDLGAILGPFFDLVEVAVVRDQRIVGFFGGRAYCGWIALWRQGSHVRPHVFSADRSESQASRLPRQVRRAPFRL